MATVGDPVGFDPTNPVDVATQLVSELRTPWVDAELLGRPEFVPAATSTWVWFVELGGSSVPARARGRMVLRIFEIGHEEQADRESRLGDELVRHGYPAPAAIWKGELGGYPAQLQQRVAGVPVMDAIAGPRIRSIVASMGVLQARLHGLPIERFDVPTMSASAYLDADLARRRESVGRADPSGTWEWLNRTARSVGDGDIVLCHGDFHPLNAVITPDGAIGIVDWTDACLADRHLDVGRTVALFKLAFVLAQTRTERWALRALRGRFVAWHLRAYRSTSGVTLDERVLAWWQVVHSYRGWLQLGEVAEGAVTSRASSTLDAFPDDLSARLLDQCAVLRRDSGW